MSVASTVSRRSLWTPLAAGLAVGASTAALAFADPNSHTILLCPLKVITGFVCPFCGGLRATADLAHGDLVSAWLMNPLWVLTVPLLVLAWANWIRLARRGRRPRQLSSREWKIIAIVILAFGVLRNVPILDVWLGPAA